MANWKIESIKIENFKFFKEPFSFNLKGKNVLLYGENGAGKSSIYWSFYTHFQAYEKIHEQAIKYFQPEHNENLRNRYASNDDYSGISVTFNNENGGTLTIEDSLTNFYCNDPAMREFMRLTMMSSDFMNYKFLSSLFDFCNSEDNEVFSMFEKEVLPFIDLDAQFTPIFNIQITPSLNSGEWWTYLKSVYTQLPKNRKNHNFNQQTNEYKAYQKLLKQFNELLKDALVVIEGVANSILRNSFQVDARIKLNYVDAAFNLPKGKRSRDGNLYPPKILIHALMDGDNVKDKSIITHPKSFFNEAKITCMALALRLAILERRPGSSQSASVLFIDDLLISLDMSFRKHVIRILFDNYVDKYQIVLFTHDRSFFHLVWSEIENRKRTKDWIKCELYATNSGSYPKSHLLVSPTYVEQAKIYLKTFQLAACANTLRRFCEQQMKRILPANMQIQLNDREVEKVNLDLNGLITNYKKFIAQCKLTDMAPSLQNDRRLILNPFSHDDMETPFYRQELENLIIELERLSTIEKRSVIGYNQIFKPDFQIKVQNGEIVHSATIEFLETLISLDYEGQQYLSNPKVKVVSSSDEHRIPLKKYVLRNLFSLVYNAVSYNSTTAPQLKDCLFQANGSPLL